VTIDWSHQVQFRRLAPPLETALYRILQEGLTNALRHSQSDHVRMRLAQDGDWLTLQVEDQGIGFRPEDVPPDRFGLQGIRERARLFGGQAMIHSELGQGTRIVVVLPVVEMEEDQPAGALSE
jgi:signal transduction histidine kinase